MVGRYRNHSIALGYATPLLTPTSGGVLLGAILTAIVLMMPVSQNHDNRWRVVQPYNSKLERIAYCESHGHWYINTGNGFYGGLQFTLGTWRSVGGRGYPHQNSVLEQKYRAVLLIKRNGYGPWPVCGYR